MKIGCVPYLNARPLVEWFNHFPHSDIALSYAPPAVLIEQLFYGKVDLVMASTFPSLVHRNLYLLPGLGVTASGPVLSVRLLSRVPIGEIRRLALDVSSRSSVVLARIILADQYGIFPDVRVLPPDLAQMLDDADAAAIIGDRGLAIDAHGLRELDLGQAWWDLTGLPFYFAGWMARDPDILQTAAPMLFAACEWGMGRLPQIAHESAVRLHLPEELCYRYLTEVMRYQTGEAEIAGLTEFAQRADRLGLLRE